MNGYKEADKVSEKIDKLIEKFPITNENFLEWMRFARTLETITNIIIKKSLSVGDN